VKNLIDWQHLLFTGTWRHSKLARRSCKIRWEKHPRAFLEVVEGDWIYNFRIQILFNFYSKFWRKSCLNRGTVKILGARARRRAASLAQPRRARLALPPRRPGRACTFPRCVRLPQARTRTETARSPSSPLPTGHAAQDPTVRRGLPVQAQKSMLPPYREWKRVSFTLQHALALLVKAQPTRTPFRSTLPGRDRAARGAIAGSRGELWVRPAAAPKRAVPHLHLHLTELAGVPVLPAEPHRASTAGRGGHRAWPPAPPVAGPLPAPAESPNRTPMTPSPSSRPSLAKPGGELAGIEQPAPAGRPQGPHCKRKNLSEGFSTKGYLQ
jgi:hypothetical protein